MGLARMRKLVAKNKGRKKPSPNASKPPRKPWYRRKINDLIENTDEEELPRFK